MAPEVAPRSSRGLRAGRAKTAETPAVARVSSWWSGAGSNRRPPVFQTGALPAELPDHRNRSDLCGPSKFKIWRDRRDLNPRPPA